MSTCGLNARFEGVRIGFVRHAQSAAQALRSPVEVYEPAKLPFDVRDNGAAPIAAPLGWGDLRAAGLYFAAFVARAIVWAVAGGSRIMGPRALTRSLPLAR
jgi:hypothetical protein